MAKANNCKRAKTFSSLCPSFELKYLPPEVWRRVLEYLPGKTLLRFRCVNKSWCSDIDHPDFAYAHLKRRKIDSNKITLFALARVGYDVRIACSLTVCPGNIIKKTAYFLKSSGSFIIIGRCNELVLIRGDVSQSPGNYELQMRLCNPSIRKTLLIPPCPIDGFMYLLGFVPRTKDYKVVAISIGQYEEPTKTRVAVYTLSDQQWSVRSNDVDISGWDINIGLLLRYRNYRNRNYVELLAFYFQEAAYWFGKTHLISFNFDSEKFTFMEIPSALNERESKKHLFLLGKSLAIFSICHERSGIWVMEQGQGNGIWTKWFSGGSNCAAFDLFNPSWKWPRLNVIYYGTEDGRCLICTNKMYNIDTCQVKVCEKFMSLILIRECIWRVWCCSKQMELRI